MGPPMDLRLGVACLLGLGPAWAQPPPLPARRSRGSPSLTKEQRRARARNKAARQSRRRNRG